MNARAMVRWMMGGILLAVGAALMLTLPAAAPAQQRKPKTVTLDMQNEPVEAVLDEITNQTGLSLSARNEVLGTLVSVTLDQATPEEALAAVMAGQNWVAITNQLTGAVTLWDRNSLPRDAQSAPAVPVLPDRPSAPAATMPAMIAEPIGEEPDEPMQFQEMTHSPEEAAPLPPAEPGAAPASPTRTAAWEADEWGERALQPFHNAPFPHLSREGGWTHEDQTFPRNPHYVDNTVGIFIPNGFDAAQGVNFVVHFHGWMNDVAGVFEKFQLDKQVADSGVNAVLLVVQGPKLARDSGGGRLEQDPGAFRALIDEVAGFLIADGKIPVGSRLGKIILTAHSGGYRVTSSILKHGGLNDAISDVLLFDASYADLDNFAEWAAGDPNRRLVSLFTEHLREDNLELMALLSRRGIRFTVLPVGDMTPDALLGRRPNFIYVPKDEEENGLGHDQVVSARDFYALWLRTSALPLR